MVQNIDGQLDTKFNLECNLFTDEDGKYILQHSFYKDSAKYGGKKFKTKRSPGSGHKIIFKPKKGILNLEIGS